MRCSSRIALIITSACLLTSQSLMGVYSAPRSTIKPTPKPPTPAPSVPFKPAPKVTLPAMAKPFNMPGVVGWLNGKWEGNDYLGYLTSNISISIEIVKGQNVPPVDESSLESAAREILTKENLNPHAVVLEGPPLPFFQILIFIFPVEKDKYTVFAAGRLFEHIQVDRKHFTPAGYWQAITWENQDVFLATSQDLSAQVKALTEKLVTGFTSRYRQYNPSNPDAPKGPNEATAR